MKQDRVALLIDADNVSIDVIEQAITWVARHYGGPHLRRAWCTPESAVKHQAAFKRLSVRPMVNLAAGKNSTDIALAVDAIEIAIHEQPEVLVIVSSDSDFAPVVSRLRERGLRVVGLGQQGKVGQETRGIYDDYEVFEHRGDEPSQGARTRTRRSTSTSSSTPRTAKSTASRTAAKRADADVDSPVSIESPGDEATTRAGGSARKTTAAKKAPAKRAAKKRAAPPSDAVQRRANGVDGSDDGNDAPRPRDTDALTPPAASPTRSEPSAARSAAPSAPRRSSRKSAAKKSPPEAPAPHQDAPRGRNNQAATVTLDALLRALPELSSGKKLALNDVGQRLRAARLLGKSGSSIRLLRQFAPDVLLEPDDKPLWVRAGR